MSSWNILCDFDGTVSRVDVVDSLLVRFGRPGWEAIENDWREGRIGSRECMARQVALLDLSRAELDAHLAGIDIDPAFAAFAADAHKRGLGLRIVSDGLDYAILTILARHGLTGFDIAANHLRSTGPRSWALDSPWQADNCNSGTCKCACTDDGLRSAPRKTLLIGDGRSDFCVAGRVDLVFAKAKLLEFCRGSGIPHLPMRDFADARALLDTLEPRRPVEALLRNIARPSTADAPIRGALG